MARYCGEENKNKLKKKEKKEKKLDETCFGTCVKLFKGGFIKGVKGTFPCGLPRVVIPVPHQVRDKLQPESGNTNWISPADPVLSGVQVRHGI